MSSRRLNDLPPAGLAWRSGPWRLLAPVSLGLGLLALSGCGSTEPAPPPPPCPTALLLEGAERTTAYRAGAEARASEIRYIAVLTNLSSSCRYYNDPNGPGVDVDLGFDVIAERGPALLYTEEVTYFVATVGPDGQILDRQELGGDLPFAEDEQRVGLSEDLTLRLPTVTPGDGGAYRLYIGFLLDDAELARRRQMPAP